MYLNYDRKNGVAVSGGQKQRIGLARSIINKPDLLILDEATSALNSQVSNKIIKNLKNYDIIIILISHDKKISNICNTELYLRNGNIKIL